MKVLRYALVAMAIAANACFASDTSAQVFLSKDEAVTLVLGKDCVPHYEPKDIPIALDHLLKEKHLWSEETKKAHFFTCRKDETITGYALIDAEVGKHLPITYIVGIEPDGSVRRVEVMVFREVRGWEVKDERFTRQFKGKKRSEESSIGSSIKSVTGATLSSEALAKGVGRALEMWQFFYGVNNAERSSSGIPPR